MASERTARPGRIAFAAAPTDVACEGRQKLVARYGECPMAEADVIVPLGGDGFMLQTLHRVLDLRKPVYGMNCGSVGFLMNEFREDGLLERLAVAQDAVLHPLRMRAVRASGAVEDHSSSSPFVLNGSGFKLANHPPPPVPSFRRATQIFARKPQPLNRNLPDIIGPRARPA